METLIGKIEACPDPAVRETARELLRETLSFHGKALAKIIEMAGSSLLERLARDPGVAPALLLHGLHPETLGSRVEKALARVRPYLASHGGNVELLGVEDGRVRLRLQGSCQGCPSSAETLKGAVEEAIAEAAPDAAGIEVA